MKKTAAINVMVDPSIKARLLDKAKALNLTLTAYLEKIGSEPVVFLDSNVRAVLSLLKVSTD